MTTIGGQQDEMVGECRWVVKRLRQKASTSWPSTRERPVATEIPPAQKMLQAGGL
jgi:hypothetical protein